jgi:uncharacterized protein YukJ
MNKIGKKEDPCGIPLLGWNRQGSHMCALAAAFGRHASDQTTFCDGDKLVENEKQFVAIYTIVSSYRVHYKDKKWALISVR